MDGIIESVKSTVNWNVVSPKGVKLGKYTQLGDSQKVTGEQLGFTQIAFAVDPNGNVRNIVQTNKGWVDVTPDKVKTVQNPKTFKTNEANKQILLDVKDIKLLKKYQK
ncbi:hypothetical protein ACFLZV_00680 [Candidatus Margulisiibacteriota bacterium]